MAADPTCRDRIESIFHEARQRPPHERKPFLDGACGGDHELQRAVEALLGADGNGDSFLDRPAALGETSACDAMPNLEGTTVGRYKLLQKLGEGGFGVVYMAEQEEPVRRKVALKIVKPGMDSRAVITRFEAERQALALASSVPRSDMRI